MKQRLLLSVAASLLVSVVTATGCGDEDQPDTPVQADGPRVHGLTPTQRAELLAKIGPTEITVGEFAEELASKGPYVSARYNSPERRREFLDQMVRFELLAQEAERRGFDELPEVRRTRKQRMVREFLRDRFEESGPEDIPEEEVRAYYDEHSSEFNSPPQVRASHIQFRDRATANRVLRRLAAAPTDVALYRRLAEEHNTDETTRERLGDLRFFSRVEERTEREPEIPAEIVEAAFSIERIGGLFEEIVRTERGHHIVKLTGRRAAMRRSFEEAERMIRSRLHRDRRERGVEELLERLREEVEVEVDESLLSEVRVNLPEGDSPTVTSPQLNPRLNPALGGALPSSPIGASPSGAEGQPSQAERTQGTGTAAQP